jgi:hypothetical protein
MIGKKYWPRVTGIQKSIMQHMKVTRILETRQNGTILFEVGNKRYLIEPSGEVMSGGTQEGAEPEERLIQAWEEATPEKRQEWLAKLKLPLQYRHKHWLELRRGVKDLLTKEYLLGTVPYIPNPEYEKCMIELAKWFVRHKRKMTLKDMRPIVSKYFSTDEKAEPFHNYLASPEGGGEFRKLLRLEGWKAGMFPQIPEVEPHQPRRLQTFRGYTVDYRLREFRSIEYKKPMEFLSFDSPRGQELIREMQAQGLWERTVMPLALKEDDVLKYYQVPPSAY